MSIEREFRRRAYQANMRANGMRSTCRKCKEKMLCKPGYGWVCPACGWEPFAQVKTREELMRMLMEQSNGTHWMPMPEPPEEFRS